MKNKEQPENYCQVGDTIRCGHCEPGKYQAATPCDCVCHKKPTLQVEDWRERFNKKYSYANFCWNMKNETGRKFAEQTRKNIRRFISTTISQAVKQATAYKGELLRKEYQKGYDEGRNEGRKELIPLIQELKLHNSRHTNDQNIYNSGIQNVINLIKNIDE